ncbi:hypothetical protein OJ996_20795 [Luteolibacter sp. GHJ8]|uniref:Uncharacterized protein n=1 Tax=Luteolibacter rhizosphaerae TaxID=2989719 RepID=A0ABT3G864_9BACT|nr:hypothetical protein [Luteolibacter rhizosphaerae]MCW1916039.1 hypothetical protein [Luteolibacter rhizosphaerae]
MENNPYAAPAAPLDYTPPGSNEAEIIRRDHIKHEASVKGIGSLWLIGSVFFVLAAIGGLFATGASEIAGAAMGISGLLLLLGILGFWVAFGIRRLNPAARIVGGILTGISVVLSIFSLPQSVIGLLINAYILSILFSKKGSMVFSPSYKDIIAVTPHIRYRTPLIVWIILGLFVLLIVGGLAAAFFMSPSGGI